MKFTEEKLIDQGQAKWIITIDGQEWQDLLKKARNKIKNNLEIPGFRKGKAPEAKLASFLTPTKVYNEAFKLALQPAFEFARSQEAKISPLNAPSPVPAKVNEQELVINFVFDLRPDIKLGSYTGISSVEKPEIKITDQEVDQVIDSYCQQFAMEKLKPEDAKIAKGDLVIFDFKGYVDDKPFDGGEAKDFRLEIGSNQFIPGFEDAMIGLSVGENQEINVKFPEQYVESLSGKAAKFVLNIKSISQRILPAKDDELAKDLNIPEIQTFEQLKQKVRQDLLKSKTIAAKTEFVDKIIDEIIKNSEIELPKSAIEKQAKQLKKDFQDEIARQGVDLKQYKEFTKLSDQDIEDELHRDAKRRLQAYLITSEIKLKESLQATEEKIKTKLEEIAKQYNLDAEQIKTSISTEALKLQVEDELIYDFLYDKNGK
ncbi:trigger factor [Mycoplasma putrefaciens]|uniref:Trigger factor n=1 Tax=Mycoplasma putrefaciens (strain ATCC 15718 / NCTC 10155 / C30 KS-1 / KS-1) TaxID=743965 RepID=A0A7U3ZSK3_MYCPK|nr:trigger factor [Mycoplasma putrefaciens]AEM68694.1 trigger factor [Mycoplasma putrefaciens KS1]